MHACKCRTKAYKKCTTNFNGFAVMSVRLVLSSKPRCACFIAMDVFFT